MPDNIPTPFLRTTCSVYCPRIIEWEYDPGYAGSYWEPSEPDFLVAVSGCSESHLEQATVDHPPLGDLYRLIRQYQDFVNNASWLRSQSRVHLGVGPRRSLFDIVNREE